MSTNYTKEQVELLTKFYAEGIDLGEISAHLNKSKASIVAKLSKLGLYQPKQQRKRLKKLEMLEEIEKYFHLPANSLDSVEKATHEAISLIYNAI